MMKYRNITQANKRFVKDVTDEILFYIQDYIQKADKDKEKKLQQAKAKKKAEEEEIGSVFAQIAKVMTEDKIQTVQEKEPMENDYALDMEYIIKVFSRFFLFEMSFIRPPMQATCQQCRRDICWRS